MQRDVTAARKLTAVVRPDEGGMDASSGQSTDQPSRQVVQECAKRS